MERWKLESAATNYSYLRGLLSIPLGVVLIVAALEEIRGLFARYRQTTCGAARVRAIRDRGRPGLPAQGASNKACNTD